MASTTGILQSLSLVESLFICLVSGAQELSLTSVVLVLVLLLDSVHFAFELGGLLFKLEQSIVLVLDHTGHVGDLLLKLFAFALKLILLQSVVLKLLAHFDETFALVVAILEFKRLIKRLSFVSPSLGRVKGTLGLTMLRLNTHVVIFKRILVISQVLDDSVHLLGFCLTDVGAFALLNFVLQVHDVLIGISDCLLFHLN